MSFSAKEGKEMNKSFQSNFNSQDQGKMVSSIRAIREKAFLRFNELGFPTTKSEEWKYTNVLPLTQTPFSLPKDIYEVPDYERVKQYTLENLPGPKIIFVNGRFVDELSQLKAHLPKGVKIYSFQNMFLQDQYQNLDPFDRQCLEKHLAHHALYQDQPFVTLNTAFIKNGLFIRFRKGTIVEKPIQVIFFSTNKGENFVTHPRSLIVLEEGAQANLITSYVGLSENAYFSNPVDEIVLEKNSLLNHYKIQWESRKAYHISHIQVDQEQNSHYISHNYSFGGHLVRNDINSLLDDEGAECTFNGLFVAGENQHVDHHTLVDHVMPNCNSREYYKGILSGKAQGVFNGKIIVRPDAQKTNAIQSNKNLLLSKDATIDTKPQLEIFANDVKCTHGATVGQLDENAQFYLQTRGINKDQAHQILIEAFAKEITNQIKIDALKHHIENLLISSLKFLGELN